MYWNPAKTVKSDLMSINLAFKVHITSDTYIYFITHCDGAQLCL